MNWRSLDLNLLVVFDAVARARGVNRAAMDLAMSPSAVSHAIARLRRALGDDLFDRGPHGLVPTPRALELAGPVRDALDRLQAALVPDFDCATSRHRFTIAFDNRSALLLAAPLTRHLAARAPGIGLDIAPSGTVDLVDRIERGLLHLAAAVVWTEHRLKAATLFEDRLAVLTRPDHPAAATDTISVEHLTGYGHIHLSSTDDDHGSIDSELAKRGVARRIACRAPLLSTDSILLGSDLLTVVGARTARAFARTAGLKVLALPFPTPPIVTSMLWHPRWDAAPAHRWLRGAIRDAADIALA